MALTSTDETDLILPLYGGLHEQPRFSTFLERLRRRTQAEYVGLILRSDNAALEDATEYFAGRNLRREARNLALHEIHMLERVHFDRLRPGRVYSPAEFVDHDPDYRKQRARNAGRLGIADERVVRIMDEDGVSAWLVMARGSPCNAADSALLSNLSQYMAVALRSLVLMERQRIAAAISAEGLFRTGTGWIVFDGAARILAIDAATQRCLHDLTGHAPQVGTRLLNVGMQSEKELTTAAANFAENPQAAARAIALNETPRLEALLTPAASLPASILEKPVMLALCRLPKPGAPDRAGNLARLFDLPLREAELAIGLSDGLSLAEAGEALGLTLETTRNYSKRLYAKLGARGQAELVRLVYESSAHLS